MRTGRFTRALLGLAPLCLALAACMPKLKVEPVGLAGDRADARPTAEAARRTTSVKVLGPDGAVLDDEAAVAPVAEATAEEIAALLPDRRIAATLPPQPLAQFIDTVFGQVLQVPYYTGPGVANRRDVVTLRGPVAVSSRQFFAMVQAALRQYGLAVTIENGAVRVVGDQRLAQQAPPFMRSRVAPDTPAASRPVIQFAALRQVEVGPVSRLLEDAYPNRAAVHFAAQESGNSVVISGDPQEVASAVALTDLIDQPSFVGGQVARIEPVYWPAARLAQSVAEVLTTEGYQVGVGVEGGRHELTFLPIPFANAVLLFSQRPDAFARALYWIRELDSLAGYGDQESVFSYTVRNTTASELGALIAQLETGGGPVLPAEPALAAIVGPAAGAIGPVAGRPPMPRPSPKPGSDPEPTGPITAGRVTIDPGGNRLLFRGTRSEFERVRALMEELDTPPRQVLVEITVAEVTLTDETRFGIDWFLETEIGGGSLVVDTRGSAVKEPGGLGMTYTEVFSNGRVQVALSAIAENRNLNILSTPRLVARSGSEAQILIGTDVPIITSQRASDSQTGGDTDILQTVQYRQTGVILNMRPVVYGDDRVDIELFQEVSSQEPNQTSAIDSPLILNRSVSTQLSLREGMTAVIGGLIQDNYSREQRGVPVLKDIPLLGAALRSDAVSGAKTELLILVTPYIIRDDGQMAGATAAYASSLNRMLRRRGPQVYTLLPWTAPFSKPRVHGGLSVMSAPRADGPDPAPPAGPSAAEPAAPTAEGAPQGNAHPT